MWLAAYNLVSATLWAIVFGRVVSIAPAWGNAELMRSTGTFTRWVQTMAVVEIFHSLFGKALPFHWRQMGGGEMGDGRGEKKKKRKEAEG